MYGTLASYLPIGAMTYAHKEEELELARVNPRASPITIHMFGHLEVWVTLREITYM